MFSFVTRTLKVIIRAISDITVSPVDVLRMLWMTHHLPSLETLVYEHSSLYSIKNQLTFGIFEDKKLCHFGNLTCSSCECDIVRNHSID